MEKSKDKIVKLEQLTLQLCDQLCDSFTVNDTDMLLTNSLF